MTMAEAVKEYLGVDFMAIDGDAEAVAAAKAIGVTWTGGGHLGPRPLRVL